MRIKVKPPGEYPLFLRPFFWNQKRKYGAVLDASLLWARIPRLFLAVAHLYGAAERKNSPIRAALRSLVTVRVSQLNGCRFCVDINSATLLKRGISEDNILALFKWRESDLFGAMECAALDYAECVTKAPDEIGDDQFAQLRRHFDDDVIIELTALIAFQNMSSQFNSALGVQPQGFCQIEGIDRTAGTEVAPHESSAISSHKLPKQGGKVG